MTTETENVPSPSPILMNTAVLVLKTALLGLQANALRTEAVLESDEQWRYATAFGMSRATLASIRTDIVHALNLLGVDTPYETP